MDTIVGKDGKGAIVTLVDRKSCYMLMEKLDTGKQAVPMAHTVVRLLRASRLPVRTITTDNGSEFAAHQIIARELNTTVYFAHPYSSWEKGAIENINGLIRQYIPKKTDFRGISSGFIAHVTEKLNNRPRKKMDLSNQKTSSKILYITLHLLLESAMSPLCVKSGKKMIIFAPCS